MYLVMIQTWQSILQYKKKQSKDLLMYDRLAIDEMLENYIKFESDLLIYDSDKHKGNVN